MGLSNILEAIFGGNDEEEGNSEEHSKEEMFDEHTEE